MELATAAQLSKLPTDRWVGLRYDDLLDSPASVLADLTHFLGIAADESWLRDATSAIDQGRPGRAAAMLSIDTLAEVEIKCVPAAETIAELYAQRGARLLGHDSMRAAYP